MVQYVHLHLSFMPALNTETSAWPGAQNKNAPASVAFVLCWWKLMADCKVISLSFSASPTCRRSGPACGS